MPYRPVVYFVKCVQLAVVGPAVSLNLRLRVLLKNALNEPLAVDKTAVLDEKRSACICLFVAQLADRANCTCNFPCKTDMRISPWNDHQLLVQVALGILAVAEPTEAVPDFSIPSRLPLPGDLLYVLDSVEGKVNSERNLGGKDILVGIHDSFFLIFVLYPIVLHVADTQTQIQLRHFY